MLRALTLRRSATLRQALLPQSRPTLLLPHLWPHRSFSQAQASVSIHNLAVYIHEQVNGTFPDIFRQLSERVDVLEYPNAGSRTMVSFDDACIIVEDIGASAADLPTFLAEDAHLEKSVSLLDETGEPTIHYRHPHVALQASNNKFLPELSANTYEAVTPTNELLLKTRQEALGIWYYKRALLYVVRSHRGGSFHMTTERVERLQKKDGEFNVWFKTQMNPGWQGCSGKCAGQAEVRWYDVTAEDPPCTSACLKRVGCIGYCRTARKQQEKDLKDK